MSDEDVGDGSVEFMYIAHECKLSLFHLSYDDSASDKNDKQHQKHAESLKKNNV